jgi:hypothetical protein
MRLFDAEVTYRATVQSLADGLVARMSGLGADMEAYAEVTERWEQAKDQALSYGLDVKYRVMLECEASLHRRLVEQIFATPSQDRLSA